MKERCLFKRVNLKNKQRSEATEGDASSHEAGDELALTLSGQVPFGDIGLSIKYGGILESE